MLVGAVDYRVWGSETDAYSARWQRLRREVGWPPEQPETLAWMASLKRMRDRKETFSSIAPFTIYPIPAEDVADIVMGVIDLVFCLDLAALETTLNDGRVEVHIARPPECPAPPEAERVVSLASWARSSLFPAPTRKRSARAPKPQTRMNKELGGRQLGVRIGTLFCLASSK